jgi:hypothetical protein
MTWIETKEALINLEKVICITHGQNTIVFETEMGSFHVTCKNKEGYEKTLHHIKNYVLEFGADIREFEK